MNKLTAEEIQDARSIRKMIETATGKAMMFALVNQSHLNPKPTTLPE